MHFMDIPLVYHNHRKWATPLTVLGHPDTINHSAPFFFFMNNIQKHHND